MNAIGKLADDREGITEDMLGLSDLRAFRRKLCTDQRPNQGRNHPPDRIVIGLHFGLKTGSVPHHDQTRPGGSTAHHLLFDRVKAGGDDAIP
ncbi:hypothetical protein [Asticcacaulis excentricus]|uniref:hypothetical protein n=1 Tax=Asticcacaulis excentricus TaxID=78587 RepID=UPI00117E5105|nr:hypothetical protein [Asticcacaulis excentricus]